MRSQVSVGLCLIGITLGALSFDWKAMALPRETSAAGDDCTIDLPNGLKKPGKMNSNGKCCSIWDSNECYDVAKSIKEASAASKSGKTVATVGSAGGSTPARHYPGQGKTGVTSVSGGSTSASPSHSVAPEKLKNASTIQSNRSSTPT